MTKSSNFSQSSKSNRRRSTILRRKEKDSRNSSLPRRTFLGRVVRRGGVWMLPHRSDTSRGHLHPPTHPRLTLSPFLHPSCSSVSTSQPHRQGGFSRAAAYAATFLGALARDSSLPLPAAPSSRLCNYQDSPLATPCSRRTARRCNGHCLRVKSFHPQTERVRPIAMRSGRLHDFSNFRSYTIESIYTGNVLEENLVSIGCERASNARGDAFVHDFFSEHLRLFEQGIPNKFCFVYLTKILLLVYFNIAILKYCYNTFPLINV